MGAAKNKVKIFIAIRTIDSKIIKKGAKLKIVPMNSPTNGSVLKSVKKAKKIQRRR